jgi:hypothetical protein
LEDFGSLTSSMEVSSSLICGRGFLLRSVTSSLVPVVSTSVASSSVCRLGSFSSVPSPAMMAS